MQGHFSPRGPGSNSSKDANRECVGPAVTSPRPHSSGALGSTGNHRGPTDSRETQRVHRKVQSWRGAVLCSPNSHSESSDGAKVPRAPGAEQGRDGKWHRAAPCPLPTSRMSRRGCEEPLKAAGIPGHRAQAGGKAAAPGEVLPAQHRTRFRAMLPAQSPAGFWRQCSLSPAHLGPPQHPTQPPHFRSSNQADFHPWRQQRRPSRAPSTLAKHQPRKDSRCHPQQRCPCPAPCCQAPGGQRHFPCSRHSRKAGAVALPSSEEPKMQL